MKAEPGSRVRDYKTGLEGVILRRMWDKAAGPGDVMIPYFKVLCDDGAIRFFRTVECTLVQEGDPRPQKQRSRWRQERLPGGRW